jgi:hypothetical protein
MKQRHGQQEERQREEQEAAQSRQIIAQPWERRLS